MRIPLSLNDETAQIGLKIKSIKIPRIATSDWIFREVLKILMKNSEFLNLPVYNYDQLPPEIKDSFDKRSYVTKNVFHALI